MRTNLKTRPTPTATSACGLCGKTTPKRCGLYHHPEWRRACPMSSCFILACSGMAPVSAQPHEDQPDPRRCGAHARSTGEPCRRWKLVGVNRCRLHGGRSTGPKPKHGRRSLRQQRLNHLVLLLKRMVRAIHPHLPPRPVAWDPVSRRWVDVVKDEHGEYVLAPETNPRDT